jgi:hypothetical protein
MSLKRLQYGRREESCFGWRRKSRNAKTERVE